MLVLDYSYKRPSPAAIKAAGYSGVIRYLSYEASKNLGHGERDALWREGLSIGLVWETTAGAPLQGYAKGRADAFEANRQAAAFGWPGDVVIIYAVDFDARQLVRHLPRGITLDMAVDQELKVARTAEAHELVLKAFGSEMDQVADYFRGVLSVGGRPAGVYGPDHVCDRLAFAVPLACYWQCAAWSGVGEGTGGSVYVPGYGRNIQLSREACLFQFYGSVRLDGTDHNESTGHAAHHLADLMYHPDGHEPAPLEEDEDMARLVKMPDHTGQAVWLLTTDGVGRPRRVEVSFPKGTSGALESKLASGVEDLHGDAADGIFNEWLVAGPIMSEWQEAGTVLKVVGEATAKLLAAIEADPEVATPELPADFVQRLADGVATELNQRLAE